MGFFNFLRGEHVSHCDLLARLDYWGRKIVAQNQDILTVAQGIADDVDTESGNVDKVLDLLRNAPPSPAVQQAITLLGTTKDKLDGINTKLTSALPAPPPPAGP
ncbi:MAG: hypothetical protein ACR2KS_10065 [Candidatus Eremiobacter antarcticus]|nr:hypothetical protein [Candidatus Eremiobacteraeota bacterium]MBC5808778.1 hypothetical protein [Candidatus Eremiobacteraeota bacterium]